MKWFRTRSYGIGLSGIHRGNDANIRVQDSFSSRCNGRLLVTYTHHSCMCTVILVVKITKKYFPQDKGSFDPSAPYGSDTAFPLLHLQWLIMSAFISAMCCYCICSALLFLFLLIPLSYRYLHQRLCRNKHDRLETLSQCGERPRFAFQHFFENLTRGHKIRAHRNFNAPCLSHSSLHRGKRPHSPVVDRWTGVETKMSFPLVLGSCVGRSPEPAWEPWAG